MWLDSVGAISIGIAAAVCGGLVHAWESPLGACIIVVCGAILTPFLLVASVATSLGVICCMPVAVGAFSCAYLPSLLRHLALFAVTVLARLWKSSAATKLRLAAGANPLGAMLVGGGVLALSPLLLFFLVVGAFWYLLLAPLTVTLTALLCYNHLPAFASLSELLVVGEAPLAPLQGKRRRLGGGSTYSGYGGSTDAESTLGSSSHRTGPSGHGAAQGRSVEAFTSRLPSDVADSQATGLGADDDDFVPPRPSFGHRLLLELAAETDGASAAGPDDEPVAGSVQ